MKILWCTVDRSNRVAPHIFKTLMDEVSKIEDVTVVSKSFKMLTGEVTKNAIWKKEKHFTTGKKLSPKEINKNYDVVFTDALFGFMHEDWQDIKIPKGLLIEDLHGELIQYLIAYALDNFKFNFVFTRYRNASRKLLPEIYKVKTDWIPHSINPELLKDYGLVKNYGILLTGSLNSTIYPLRSFVYENLNSYNFFTHITRPAESVYHQNPWPTGIEYFKLLNSSKMSVCSTSIYYYPVIKMFEIPACKSILLSDCTNEMKQLGFVPNENMIEINVKNLCNQIHNVLKNEEFMKEIAENGYNLIHKYHTGKQRAFEFVDKLYRLG